MALEMGESQEGIIVQKAFADGHSVEPFAAFDRKHRGAVGFVVDDVDRCEGPAIDLQRFPVLGGRVAVAFMIGVCFDDRGIRDFLFKEFLDPRARQDVRAVLFAGVQLDGDLACQVCTNLFINLLEPFGGKVSCEIDDRFISFSFFVRNVMISAGSWFCFCHNSSSFGGRSPGPFSKCR